MYEENKISENNRNSIQNDNENDEENLRDDDIDEFDCGNIA